MIKKRNNFLLVLLITVSACAPKLSQDIAYFDHMVNSDSYSVMQARNAPLADSLHYIPALRKLILREETGLKERPYYCAKMEKTMKAITNSEILKLSLDDASALLYIYEKRVENYCRASLALADFYKRAGNYRAAESRALGVLKILEKY